MNLVNFRKQNGKNNGAFYLLLTWDVEIVDVNWRCENCKYCSTIHTANIIACGENPK